MFTLQTSNPVNHLTQNETYFPTLAVRMSACRNTVVPISSLLCVLKRWKLLLFIPVLFLSHGPLFFFLIIVYLLVHKNQINSNNDTNDNTLSLH